MGATGHLIGMSHTSITRRPEVMRSRAARIATAPSSV